MSEKDNPSVKQGAVTPRKLRIAGFRGAFRDTVFDNNGISTAPVSPETEEALKKQFPRAKVEAVRDEAKTETTEQPK